MQNSHWAFLQEIWGKINMSSIGKYETYSFESAFPTDSIYNEYRGIRKREYFAALALQGMVDGRGDIDVDVRAKLAVKYADALIAALNAK